MIKIAVMSTSVPVKKHFCNQILDEFLGRDNEVVMLSETSLESPFRDDIEYMDDDILWIYSKQMLKELEANLQFDVTISKCSVIEPFLYANALSINNERLTAAMNAANQWMETYDTIVWLKNDDLHKDVIFEHEYLEMMEFEYMKWITDRKDRLPISIINCKNITNESQNWLI